MSLPPAAESTLPGRRSRAFCYAIPLLWSLALAGWYAIPFARIPWPFVDVYSNFYNAYALTFRQGVVEAFGRGVEYRPFFTILINLQYRLFGLQVDYYKAEVFLQLVAILVTLTAILKPDNVARAIAALLAFSCVLGLHTSRILLAFFPVNHHSIVLLLILLSALLVLDGSARRNEWLLGAITLVALFFIEFGLLIPPIITVLWLSGAKGVNGRAVFGGWVALLLYAAIRLSLGTHSGIPVAHTESGLGFSEFSEAELRTIFRHAPWMFWIYNAVAGFFSVMFSEPRRGRYLFVEALLSGHAETWQWIHVLSSVATTAFLGWYLRRPDSSPRDRLLQALGLALLIFGGGIGLLYNRDRIGLPAGVGYAILLYVAAAGVLERRPAARWHRAAAAVLLTVLTAAWLIRDAETWFSLRDSAWAAHVEWTDRYADLCGVGCPHTDLLDNLRIASLSTTPDDPHGDPAWTYVLFEREY